MTSIPLTDEVLDVARRVIWFEEPEVALSDPIRFLTYAMTYGTHTDMRTIRRYVTDTELREALDRAPPGVMDRRSWSYWNLVVGRHPAPPRPMRDL